MKKSIAGILVWFLTASVGGRVLVAREISGEEATKWSQASGEKDPATRATLVEAYLQAYPQGAYQAQAHYILTMTYEQLKQVDKVVLHGEETLKADPESIDVLLTLASVYSGKPETYQKSIEYSDRGLKAIDKKAATPPPSGISAEVYRSDLDKYKKRAVYLNGFVKGLSALQAKDFAGAETPLKNAYLAAKNQMVAYFLGVTYAKNGKIDDAISVLCEAVAQNGPKKEVAQKELERLYQEKNHSLDGLQQKIDEAKTKVGRNG